VSNLKPDQTSERSSANQNTNKSVGSKASTGLEETAMRVDNISYNKPTISPSSQSTAQEDQNNAETYPNPAPLNQQDVSEELKHDFAMQKRLLASCEKVNLLNASILMLEGFPDNWSLDQARKTRDVLLMLSATLLSLFSVGLVGLFPAVMTGLMLGLGLLFGALALSPIQSSFTGKPTLGQLIQQRRQLVQAAQAHVQFLEGGGGLVWRCEALGHYNRHLYRNQFNVLVQHSKNGNLARVLRTPAHFRLYIQFMIEAQKAYRKLQAIYLSEGFGLTDD